MALRIFSGKHKGRKILMKEGIGIRPTGGRTREALFNILSHGEFGSEETSPLIGKQVADLFCGCGALGLEALSRGAKHVIFVDQSSDSLALVRGNLDAFGETANSRCVRSDSSSLPRATAQCSLVFLDPPYKSGVAAKSLASLAANNWLLPGAVCVVEVSRAEDLEAPKGFTIFDMREYGNTKVFLVRFAQ